MKAATGYASSSGGRSDQLRDVTTINFIAQLAQVGVFIVAFILYAHLVPALQSLGQALLTGVSVVSIVIGLAAQSTLGNIIAGLSLVLYHPFAVGDEVQLNTPRGLATGTIQALTLGYTVLVSSAGEQIIVPNSVMAGVVLIKPALKGDGQASADKERRP